MQAKKVYGIDLGTTYSCIASVDEHSRPIVHPNTENTLTTPSVVYYQTPDNIVVGQTAKDAAKAHPDDVVQMVKRHMGDADWVRSFHGKDYRPADVSAMILRKVVEDAMQVTGEKIEDVIITVPAYFGNVEKEATKQAGIIAGLNVRFIVPEPVAAAFAYGFESNTEQTIMVYDLGGGTFDGTILKTPGTVISTVGDHNLGGKDWDEDLVNFFAQKFQEQTGKSSDDLLSDLEIVQELFDEAEKCKIGLSSKTSHTVRVRAGINTASVEVTREDFDRITKHRLDRTIEMTHELLQRGKEKGIAIDTILLVGGSTFMPQVENRLKEEFSFKLLRKDPNQIVAKGAALLGFKYQIDEEIKRMMESGSTLQEATQDLASDIGMAPTAVRQFNETEIVTVTARSFGIEVIDDNDELKVQNLVKIDDPLPRNVTRKFGTHADQQQSVSIKVMENQYRVIDEQLVPPGDCREIGAGDLPFLRPLPKDSPIEVTMTLALDGTLTVEGRDLTTGQLFKGEFKSDALMSAEELAKARAHAKALKVS